MNEHKNHLQSYPERDWNQKYANFLTHRDLKFVFEGEDRNRFYFWSMTPFFSIQFFHYAMNCPDIQKSHYALYRSFLMKLSMQASRIDNDNWNLPSNAHNLNFANCFQKQLKNCKSIGNYLKEPKLESIIGGCTKTQFETLFTITSSIEQIERNGSTLKKYYKHSFA